MSKIDYSQFYIKNYMPDRGKKRKPSREPRPFKEKTGKKKGFFIFVLIITLFVLVFLNFKLSGYSFSTIKNLFVKDKDTHNYYFLIQKFTSRNKAYAQSLLIRQSGAGGYVYQEGKEYIVVYTAFSSKEDAENVAQKNKSTQVVTINLQKNTFNDCINNAIKNLIFSCQQLENGEIYEAQLLELCHTIKNELTDMKELSLKEEDNQKHISILNVFIGGLSSMESPSPTRITILGDLRYIICSVLVSLK